LDIIEILLLLHWRFRHHSTTHILFVQNSLICPPVRNVDFLREHILGVPVEQFPSFMGFFVVAKMINSWWFMDGMVENGCAGI